VVVWQSYGQDGDLGGIFGQLFDKSGKPVGGEFAVNATAAGHQARPQVSFLSDGGFAVGWTTEAIADDPGAVSVRAFDALGNPQSAEVRVVGTSGSHPNLADLTPTSEGGLNLRWFLQDDGQGVIASYVQEF